MAYIYKLVTDTDQAAFEAQMKLYLGPIPSGYGYDYIGTLSVSQSRASSGDIVTRFSQCVCMYIPPPVEPESKEDV
jgi:hypothetical protein